MSKVVKQRILPAQTYVQTCYFANKMPEVGFQKSKTDRRRKNI